MVSTVSDDYSSRRSLVAAALFRREARFPRTCRHPFRRLAADSDRHPHTPRRVTLSESNLANTAQLSPRVKNRGADFSEKRFALIDADGRDRAGANIKTVLHRPLADPP
jgi:hypothetical protein